MYKQIYFIIRPFIIITLILLLLLTISRLTLTIWQFKHFENVIPFVHYLINGIRIDLSTIGYVLILPALVHPWMLYFKHQKLWATLLHYYYISLLLLFIFLELATPEFINEFGLRPNRLFIEYLNYPFEVAKMLYNGHLSALIITMIVLALFGIASKTYLRKLTCFPEKETTYTIDATSISFLTLLLVFFMLARGTLGHRPINPAFVYLSTDPMVNSLTLNSTYSVAYAYKQLFNERNAAKIYGNMSNKKVIDIVKNAANLPSNTTSNALPTFSVHQASFKGPKKNLVIILEESLGAQFVGGLGGLPLTPQLDQLINEGLSFNNLFATGMRSVRGIEAIITGFTPTPARSVVKLDKSQHNFFTIAQLLNQNGYNTQFIYGGESHFDNMKSFFLGNGFKSIIDFNHFKHPNFVASWGVSDQDLFNQADIELTKLVQADKPFFSLIFTSSNHDPFEIPANIIKPIQYTKEQLQQYDKTERKRHQAVQYADFSLGEFIKQAKTQDYWQNTVFLIVADHDARVKGKELVPIEHFRIPAVILNADIDPHTDPHIASQIDLPPTLLSLVGVDNASPMIGQDLTQHSSNRAMMQYAENFAYLKDDEVVILQPHKQPLSFKYSLQKKKLIPEKINKTLSEQALAHALWGSLAYNNQWFKTSSNK